MRLPWAESAGTAAPRSAFRACMGAARVVLVLGVALVAAYKLADQFYWRQVQEQRLAFKERFGAVDFRDFVPERPPAEEDAGRVYRYAYALAARAGMGYDDPPLVRAFLDDPVGMELTMRQAMAALDGLWPVLQKAAGKSGGILTHFQRPGASHSAPDELRCLLDLMAAKAVLEARAGDVKSAARWLEAGMHLISLLRREPTIAAQLLRVRCIGEHVAAFQEVLNAGRALPPLGADYYASWDAAAEPTWYIRGLASELGLYWRVDVPGLTRLQRSRLILDLGTWFDRVVSAVERDAVPAPGGSANLYFPGSFAQPASAPSVTLNALVATLAPRATQQRATGFFRGAEPAAMSHVVAACGYFEIPVRTAQVHSAMALRRYHMENGVYPETLKDLVPHYLDELPIDPTTGRAMAYALSGGGAELSSPGLAELSPWKLTLK